MTVSPTAAPRRAPNARTYEGRQRQTVHALKRELGYTEIEYRTINEYVQTLNKFTYIN